MSEKARTWAARIETWRQSGKSQREFCEERGIPLSTFQWWRKRLREQTEQDREDPGFVEVALRPRQSLQGGSTVASPVVVAVGSYRVEIAGAFDSTTLETILDVLERRRC